MENNGKEQLSALMDDALEEEKREALINELKENPELQASWNTYHLIRNILQRKNDPLLAGYGATLWAKVSEQIAKEPTVVWGAEFDKPIVMNTTVNTDERNATGSK